MFGAGRKDSNASASEAAMTAASVAAVNGNGTERGGAQHETFADEKLLLGGGFKKKRFGLHRRLTDRGKEMIRYWDSPRRRSLLKGRTPTWRAIRNTARNPATYISLLLVALLMLPVSQFLIPKTSRLIRGYMLQANHRSFEHWTADGPIWEWGFEPINYTSRKPQFPQQNAQRCFRWSTPQLYDCPPTRPDPQVGLDLWKSCTTYKERYNRYAELFQEDNWDRFSESCQKGHSAVILRLFRGYEFSEDARANIAALIVELSGHYDLIISYQVGNDDAVWTSKVERERILAEVPKPFQKYIVFWSEIHLQSMYPGFPPCTQGLLAGTPVASRYRSCFMALQLIAQERDYEYYINWEADLRYTGDYLDLFDKSIAFATAHTDHANGNFYIPGVHTPYPFDKLQKKPDFISWSPMFHSIQSQWIWRDDIVGFPDDAFKGLPRRTAIIAGAMISKRLINVMHGLNAGDYGTKKHMFCEMFPSSIASYSKLINDTLPEMKAVYVPNPVYFRTKWPKLFLDMAINDADFHINEHRTESSTWSWNGYFAKELYRGWRDSGSLLPAALIHPVKWM